MAGEARRVCGAGAPGLDQPSGAAARHAGPGALLCTDEPWAWRHCSWTLPCRTQFLDWGSHGTHESTANHFHTSILPPAFGRRLVT